MNEHRQTGRTTRMIEHAHQLAKDEGRPVYIIAAHPRDQERIRALAGDGIHVETPDTIKDFDWIDLWIPVRPRRRDASPVAHAEVVDPSMLGSPLYSGIGFGINRVVCALYWFSTHRPKHARRHRGSKTSERQDSRPPATRGNAVNIRFYEDADPFITEHEPHGGLETDVDFNARMTSLQGVEYLPCDLICRCGAHHATLVVAGDVDDQGGRVQQVR